MGRKTRVRAIAHENGKLEFCPKHPKHFLCQVTDGPHKGTTGCTECLKDIVGEIRYDRSRASLIETGVVVGWGFVGRQYEQTSNRAWKEYERLRKAIEDRETGLRNAPQPFWQRIPWKETLSSKNAVYLSISVVSILLMVIAATVKGFAQDLLMNLGIELSGVALTLAIIDRLWGRKDR
jgi:hypothetical protein